MVLIASAFPVRSWHWADGANNSFEGIARRGRSPQQRGPLTVLMPVDDGGAIRVQRVGASVQGIDSALKGGQNE